MLKRNFFCFVQGLWLKWQEKALPSAKTFHDALHQACAAEQQVERLLSCVLALAMGFTFEFNFVTDPDQWKLNSSNISERA